MKVCNKCIHDLKLIARINEYIRFPTFGENDPVLVGSRFYRTAACSTDTDHTAARLLCTVDHVCGILCYLIPLAVHMMILYVL